MTLTSFIDKLLEGDWLAGLNFKYDLTGWTQQQIDDFTEVRRLAFQQELDDSPTTKGYKIVKFTLVQTATPGIFEPSAFLSPMAIKKGPGGGGGTSEPGYPPH
jgi:hypothetical protein